MDHHREFRLHVLKNYVIGQSAVDLGIMRCIAFVPNGSADLNNQDQRGGFPSTLRNGSSKCVKEIILGHFR